MVEMIGEQRRKNNHKIRIDIDGMVNERQNISIETWLSHLVIEMVVDIPFYTYTHTQINRVGKILNEIQIIEKRMNE